MTTKKKAKIKNPTDNSVLEIPKTNWEKGEFLKYCELKDEDLEIAKIEWTELAAIYDNHYSRSKQLDTAAKYVAERLREIPKIHSVRSRVKDSQHLIKKIIRKRINDKSRNIKFDNYKQEVTDLIGIRALHLYKEDWLEIHKFILEEWDTEETPIVYIREGDNPSLTKSYESNGCKVEIHKRNYRSVHYLVNSLASRTPIIIELQVRTLFEEAWSEIDHQINYPNATSHSIVGYYLELFNRYAGSADEMGSLLQILVSDLQLRKLESARIAAERDESMQKVEELIKKAEMNETEKVSLRNEIRRLQIIDINSSRPISSLYKVSSFLGGNLELANRFLNKQRCISCEREIDFIRSRDLYALGIPNLCEDCYKSAFNKSSPNISKNLS